MKKSLIIVANRGDLEEYIDWAFNLSESESLLKARSEQQSATARQSPHPQCSSVVTETHPHPPPPQTSPRPVSQMTVDNPLSRARVKNQEKMNFDFALSDICALDAANSDHTLPSEFSAMDMLMYASSPNSLHMYDQERADMHLSFCGTVAPSTSTHVISCTSTANDDFELKSQYENSHDILPHVAVNSAVASVTSTSIQDLCSMNNMETTNMSDDLSFLKGLKGPTLAELNFSESLMDDIESIINSETRAMDTGGLAIEGSQMETYVSNVKTFTALKKPIFTSSVKLPTNQHFWCDLATTSTPVLQKAVLETNSNLLDDTVAVLSKSRHHSVPGNFGLKSPNLIQNTQRTCTVTSVTAQSDASTAVIPQTLDFQGQLSQMDCSDQTKSSSLVSELLTAGRKRTASVAGNMQRNSETVDQKWEEIKQLLKPKEETVIPATMSRSTKRERYDSGSSVFTSNDDVDSLHAVSDSDSDDFDDNYSDDGSINSEDSLGLEQGESIIDSLIGSKKEKQYFWQYNVQSKGPKGTRVHFAIGSDDPHRSQTFEDPVFDRQLTGVTIRHGGKARKGDGNDVLPNPRKLYHLGQQLKRLNKQISDFKPFVELPVSARNKSKKEKNKLASRACRLKKKAQHEANKVKLFGLNQEHQQLIDVIKEIQTHLIHKVENPENHTELSSLLEKFLKENNMHMIAGNTTDFVNTVIKKVEEGDPMGGLSADKN